MSEYVVELQDNYECPINKYNSYCGIKVELDCDGFHVPKECPRIKVKRLFSFEGRRWSEQDE